MDYISRYIVNHKKTVATVFVLLTILCAFLATRVSVNYNMVDYLPEDAQSTIALSIMDREFEEDVPNARVMIRNVSLTEALEYKEKLKQIEGITDVMWLDDVIDIKEPIEMADQDLVENYYKEDIALFSLSVKDAMEIPVTNAIYELIGENNSVSGDAINKATAQSMSASESLGAMAILIPLIILILLLSTSSWIDPILFLITIGISVLINMGTNIVFRDISFITQSISPILQMAVSLDYAIFLLHSFEDSKKETEDIGKAMQIAIKRSYPAIMASAATTLFGFLALTFMNFRIGSDLGINLAKGIVLSFITVMLFLPVLILISNQWIEKTKHRTLIPRFDGIGKVVSKLCIPCFVLALLLLIPSFLAQRNNDFIYGAGAIAPNSRSGQDDRIINETFGQSMAIVLLVPNGEVAKEAILSDELKQLKHVTSVISYATMVGGTIPKEYLDQDITNRFYSENYARVIVYTDTADEGEEAFSVVEAVQNKAKTYYEEVYTCGQSANLYDMKKVVSADNNRINLLAIISIAFVLFISFRSLSIPVILLFTIELAIWMNLSVPYFTGRSLCYIGFLVINTVQLGATVDYAILLTEKYMRNRRDMPKMEALHLTLGENFISILISGLILSLAGLCLALTSTNPIISELGMLLGRGTILSMIMVVLVLPAMLIIFDKVIDKTTLKIKSNIKNE